MSSRDRLVRFLEGRLQKSGKTQAGGLRQGESLIKSGLLDSLSLLQLAVWIEGEVGVALTLAEIDIANDWDTVDDILRYIETRRRKHLS